MKKLLITGFEPFGGESINPSWEAVSLLPDAIGDFVLTKLQIPVVLKKHPTALYKRQLKLYKRKADRNGQPFFYFDSSSWIISHSLEENIAYTSIPACFPQQVRKR